MAVLRWEDSNFCLRLPLPPMKYYIYDGEDQHGPFTLEELKSKNLTRAAMVWHQGLDEWTNAQDIEDLKEFVEAIPPSLPKVTASKGKLPPVIPKAKSKVSYYALVTLIFVLLFAYLSNPSIDKHRYSASIKLNEKLEELKDQIQPKKKFWKVVKEIGFALSSAHLQKEIQKRIAVTDYGVCSLTQVRLKNREVAIGFGAFGQVWLFTDSINDIDPNDLID